MGRDKDLVSFSTTIVCDDYFSDFVSFLRLRGIEVESAPSLRADCNPVITIRNSIDGMEDAEERLNDEENC